MVGRLVVLAARMWGANMLKIFLAIVAFLVLSIVSGRNGVIGIYAAPVVVTTAPTSVLDYLLKKGCMAVLNARVRRWSKKAATTKWIVPRIAIMTIGGLGEVAQHRVQLELNSETAVPESLKDGEAVTALDPQTKHELACTRSIVQTIVFGLIGTSGQTAR
jgi:hypothetical protein